MSTVTLRSSSGWSYPVLPARARSGALGVHEAGAAGAPKPRLLDRVREAIRTRHYSRRTEKAYVHWVQRYIFFHGKRHPAEMGAPEVTAFLTSLAVHHKVAASTQNQALSALLFLYREVLARRAPLARRCRPRQAAPAPARRPDPRRGPRRPRRDSTACLGSWRSCCMALASACSSAAAFASRTSTSREPDRHPRRQGPQGPGDDAAGRHQGRADRPPRGRSRATPGRPPSRRRLGRAARRAAAQVPERRPRMGLAMGLPGHASLRGARHRPASPASPPRIRAAARGRRMPSVPPGSPSRRPATPSVTRLPPTCWRRATTSAPSRNSWATRTSARR